MVWLLFPEESSEGLQAPQSAASETRFIYSKVTAKDGLASLPPRRQKQIS